MINPKILNKSNIIFFILVFCFFFIFFTNINPLIMYDSDDWSNITKMRQAVPHNTGNPIKVLPETFMPICGYIAAYFIYPLTKDYIFSITISAALIVSTFITLYLYSFNRLITKIFHLPSRSGLFTTLILIFFHFLIFEIKPTDNIHMFAAINLTSYFHYFIPAMICIILVLYLSYANLLPPHEKNKNNILKTSLLILAIYLAIFSTAFSSIVLVSYISYALLKNMFDILINRDKNRIKLYLKENSLYIFTIIIWFVSIIYEVNGPRAISIGSPISTKTLTSSIRTFINTFILDTNSFFNCISVIFIAAALIIYILTRKKTALDKQYLRFIVQNIICFLITIIYLILVVSKAGSWYIMRCDVIINYILYVFFIITFSLAYILAKKPKTFIIMPLLAFIVFIEIINSNKLFIETNIGKKNPRIYMEVNKYMIEQVVNADNQGLDKMNLHIPVGIESDNWPLVKQIGNSISKALYLHNIIKRPMEINIIIDPDINKKFNLYYK